MSIATTWSIARRVLLQLRRDPRTLALLFVVPCILVLLLRYIFGEDRHTFDHLAGPLVGIFPLILMFVVTSVAMLRERTSGTLERLMTLPLAKVDLLAGYGIAFALVSALQSLVVAALTYGALGAPVNGPIWLVLALGIGNALIGMSLGLLCSAFAETEFQAVQFMPAIVFPQLLLCGLFVPRTQMSDVLIWASRFMPMTWGFDGLERTVVGGEGIGSGEVQRDVVIIVGVVLTALALGALTLRRRTE